MTEQRQLPTGWWRHDCADERGVWSVLVASGEPCPWCWQRESAAWPPGDRQRATDP